MRDGEREVDICGLQHYASVQHCKHIGFELRLAVAMRSAVSWAVTSCRLERGRCFRGTHHFHLQRPTVGQVRSQEGRRQGNLLFPSLPSSSVSLLLHFLPVLLLLLIFLFLIFFRFYLCLAFSSPLLFHHYHQSEGGGTAKYFI
jgi:hypothetical protein